MKKVVFYSLFFFLAILFNSNETIAQKNFIEGYIITLKKDTVKGTIDYREWNLNPIRSILSMTSRGSEHTKA